MTRSKVPGGKRKPSQKAADEKYWEKYSKLTNDIIVRMLTQSLPSNKEVIRAKNRERNRCRRAEEK